MFLKWEYNIFSCKICDNQTMINCLGVIMDTFLFQPAVPEVLSKYIKGKVVYVSNSNEENILSWLSGFRVRKHMDNKRMVIEHFHFHCGAGN
jgi:hypothetical protein